MICALLSIAAAVTALPPGAAGEDPETAANQEPPYVEPLTEPMAVIPPGNEDLLADMLGRGTTLAGECTFGSGRVENNIVLAAYACPSGEVVVTLRHPSEAPSGATTTEKFAISVEEGVAPPQLMEDLQARVRAREEPFQWTWLEPEAIPQSTHWVALAAAAVFAGGVLWFLLRRLRRQAKTS